MTDSIPFGGLTKLGSEGGLDGVPDSPNPFYVGARDGLYLHKRMLIGRGIARVDHWPTNFPAVGNPAGIFDFDESNPIPAKLMGQVVNFFERIYDKQSTEAAVLLIMNADTREWRVFVPTQLVSHGGVNYVFDPLHIRWPWVIVGSIHSHCNFGAGHSSTDTGDAADFDGLHCTIGMIKRDVPQIVAMVAMNKKLFHYKEEQFSGIFDFSEAKQHEAPAWWDRYVENTKERIRPVGFELYAKFQKSTLVKVEPKSTLKKIDGPEQPRKPTRLFNPDHWHFDEKAGRMVYSGPDMGKGQHGLEIVSRRGSEDTPRSSMRPYTLGGDMDIADIWEELFNQNRVHSREQFFDQFSVADLEAMGYQWDSEIRTWRWTGGTAAHEAISRVDPRYVDWDHEGRLIRKQEDKYWEDSLPEGFIEVLLNSLCIADDDIDFAVGNPDVAGNIEFWRDQFIKKALGAIRVLQACGMDARLMIGHEPQKDEPKLLLPGPATPRRTRKHDQPRPS